MRQVKLFDNLSRVLHPSCSLLYKYRSGFSLALLFDEKLMRKRREGPDREATLLFITRLNYEYEF